MQASPAGFLFVILVAMTNGRDLPTPELLAQAVPGWLDVLAQLMPETVKIEVSSYVLIAVLVAMRIWRHPRKGGRRRNE